MFDAAMAARFEHVEEADDIALDVGVRVLQRVAHAGLRGEIDHAVGLEAVEGGFQRRAVFQRAFDEREPGLGRQQREACVLQRRVVVIVEVVVAQHFVAACQQAVAEGGADEAGGAGDEDAHGGRPGDARNAEAQILCAMRAIGALFMMTMRESPPPQPSPACGGGGFARSANGWGCLYSRPSTASRGSTAFTSNSTLPGLPKLRMPSAPSSANSRCETARITAS